MYAYVHQNANDRDLLDNIISKSRTRRKPEDKYTLVVKSFG